MTDRQLRIIIWKKEPQHIREIRLEVCRQIWSPLV